MHVIEVFQSVQGEGAFCGTFATFVRLAGCNLACPFCDTGYASEGVGQEIPPAQLATLIGDAWHVVWTGGEPLLQQDAIYETIALLDPDVIHELETNGTIIPAEPNEFMAITVSPKGGIDWEAWRGIWHTNYKFVATVPVPEIARCIEEHDLPKELCYVMPQTGPGIDTLKAHQQTAAACVALGLNFTPRLQTLFGWGRGQ